MMKSNAAGKVLIACCIALVSVSCGGARLSKGYSYTGSAGAPDIGGQVTLETAVPATRQTAANAETTQESTNPVQEVTDTKTTSVHDLISQSFAEPEPVRELATSALGEAASMALEGKPITHQSLARQMTAGMVSEGRIQPLSAKQQHKLDRLTAKMDKKLRQQGKEIDWKNNTGLELFFMIMAIAGLVLGIIGVAFGWFVFIVFAGLWLYWKLVKD